MVRAEAPAVSESSSGGDLARISATSDLKPIPTKPTIIIAQVGLRNRRHPGGEIASGVDVVELGRDIRVLFDDDRHNQIEV